MNLEQENSICEGEYQHQGTLARMARRKLNALKQLIKHRHFKSDQQQAMLENIGKNQIQSIRSEKCKSNRSKTKGITHPFLQTRSTDLKLGQQESDPSC